MAEAVSPFRQPPSLDLSDDNLAESFRTWRRQMDFYMRASGASEKPKKTQTAIILHCAGPQVQEVFEHFVFDENDDKEDPIKVLGKLHEFCSPQTSEVIETHRFWNVSYRAPFDAFLTDLRTRAKLCNFGAMRDRMIRDKIVFSVTGKVQELLLRERQLDLQKAVDICRVFELTAKQTKEMSEASAHVDKVTKDKDNLPNESNTDSQRKRGGDDRDSRAFVQDCNFCGRSHERKKTSCPAWGKVCSKCSRRNHFSIKCRSVNAIEANGSTENEERDQQYLAAVTSKNKQRVTALMRINDCEVRFQLDSAADVNTICARYVKKTQVSPVKHSLTMWNGTVVQPLGEAVLDIVNPKTGVSASVRFTVVENSFSCLLGVSTIQELGLITVNRGAFIASVTADTLGDLGEASLRVDPQAKPKVLPCRRIPLALQEEVHQQINKLVERGVLLRVEEPTAWVSQMAVTRKDSDGSLRICIDPQPLNAALMREHFKLPTLDDVLPSLQNAKVFTRLDVKEAFWHVRLDEPSSLLTTMITPFGRYRWSRLPFGLSVSSEIFQKRLTEALDGLDGVVCVADDIVVVGRGDDKSEAVEDHDKNLNDLQKRCAERHIKLNDKKADVRKDEITFMGHRISSTGIQPDPAKVSAILNMPPPTDVHGVRRLCGMVQYLSRFMPDLASDLGPIRALTKKDCQWAWTQECDQAFETVKKKMTNTPVLAFFDPEKELVIQVDSSKDGLGAAILQDGRPLEYASRALSPAEKNWAQIEKETLSLVFGLERFDQYTFGRKVRVQNDHKPLAAILRKPLSQASRRIQALMMRLHRYDIAFNYVPGSQLFIADTLSRAYLPDPGTDVRVFAINSLMDMPDRTREEVREATQNDPDLQTLLHVIRNGWPERKEDVPEPIRLYFDIRDTLGEQHGILLKGERVLIPRAMRGEMKRRLHAAHLGYDSMLRRARELLYWPAMAKDIKDVADHCEPCQQMKPENQKETLTQHSDGNAPWMKIGIDLFDLDGRQYLVTVDYFTSFIEVDQLKGTTASDVIVKLRVLFARYGIPAELISDGGPQFTAAEFQSFASRWGITHTMSSPLYPKANGKAEAAVKTIKHMMMKCLQDNTNVYDALLELRNTPQQDTELSPTQLMFGRLTRSRLPAATNKPVSKTQTRKARQKRQRRRQSVKQSYDRAAKDLTLLSNGQPVYYKHREGQRWQKGTVQREHSNRSYIVEGRNGAIYRRNRAHIRPTKIKPEPIPEVQQNDEGHQVVAVPDNTETALQPTQDLRPVDVPAEASTIPVRPQRARKKPSWMIDYDTT
ncbi:hypothetical protein V1264_015748 [Littorina saxatilis]|uniref:Uncharacterized protein n=1 Tax=Littorina saxatilis TaxID=31220 RepID=A0AAN9BJT7_9CAEN